jgi:hypothetical protein
MVSSPSEFSARGMKLQSNQRTGLDTTSKSFASRFSNIYILILVFMVELRSLGNSTFVREHQLQIGTPSLLAGSGHVIAALHL